MNDNGLYNYLYSQSPVMYFPKYIKKSIQFAILGRNEVVLCEVYMMMLEGWRSHRPIQYQPTQASTPFFYLSAPSGPTIIWPSSHTTLESGICIHLVIDFNFSSFIVWDPCNQSQLLDLVPNPISLPSRASRHPPLASAVAACSSPVLLALKYRATVAPSLALPPLRPLPAQTRHRRPFVATRCPLPAWSAARHPRSRWPPPSPIGLQRPPQPPARRPDVLLELRRRCLSSAGHRALPLLGYRGLVSPPSAVAEKHTRDIFNIPFSLFNILFSCFNISNS